MRWLLMDFNKPYDLLIGNYFIFKNVKTIDIENMVIIFKNGVKSPFHIKTMQEQVYSLDTSEAKNINIDHLKSNN